MKNPLVALIGFEPIHPKVLVPKTSASAVPPKSLALSTVVRFRAQHVLLYTTQKSVSTSLRCFGM